MSNDFNRVICEMKIKGTKKEEKNERKEKINEDKKTTSKKPE